MSGFPRFHPRHRKAANEDPRTAEARKRAQRLTTFDLYDWAEQAQFLYGKALLEHREQGDPVFLEEALLAAEVGLVIVQEIRSRINMTV